MTVYAFVGFLILVLAAAVSWQHRRTRSVDWELVVAFIRRDFPPEQRDVAQEIAAELAELVGFEIKQLRPEHTLEQIVGWTHGFWAVPPEELAMVFREEYGFACDRNTMFRTVVEKVVENQRKDA